MNPKTAVLAATIFYMLALAVVSLYAKRHSSTARTFTTGATTYPAVLIGFMLMSEFIGTATSVGTAQVGFASGISAAWAIASLGVGFALYSLLLAGKFKALGDNTISGVLASTYGEKTRIATSLIMIFALQVVAVSLYTSGGAVLQPLLDVRSSTAIIIAGIVAVFYVSVGGLRSVIYTNLAHAILKYVGVIIALAFGLSEIGGADQLYARLPAGMFAVGNVGWSQICAWMVAGIGAVFSTQYVVQAIATVPSAGKAQRASFYSALLLIPFGIACATIGMCARVLYPNIRSLEAFPAMINHMGTISAAIVVAGLAGSLFGSISAISIGTSTLLYRDFYMPFFGKKGDEGGSLAFVRGATLVVGLLPIPLAIMSSKVLAVTFLAKSLRASLAVLVLMAFYTPRFGTHRGAFISILAALVATIGWFLAGDPFGIDNAYIAVLVPLVVMTASHVFKHGSDRPDAALTGNEAATAPGEMSPLR